MTTKTAIYRRQPASNETPEAAFHLSQSVVFDAKESLTGEEENWPYKIREEVSRGHFSSSAIFCFMLGWQIKKREEGDFFFIIIDKFINNKCL